jgi:hydroxyethylthiazole kinase-like uncharacterized protein yjeF
VLVVGGSRRSPGAVQLAGLSALRVGAGRLTFAVGASVAQDLAVAVPESGVVPLRETRSGHVDGRDDRSARPDLIEADAVLIGPGLDDIVEARRLVRRVRRTIRRTPLIVDAYALGALAALPRLRFGGFGILTPNLDEAAILLGRDLDDVDADIAAIARRRQAAVSCHGTIAAPNGRLFHIEDGGSGLGTSGSGDVLAGAITGLAARGCDPTQAAVWGTYLHARAGMTLARSIAPMGFIASEIMAQLPHELAAVEGASSGQ